MLRILLSHGRRNGKAYKNETFKILKRSQVPSGTRISGLRFIHSVKTLGGKAFNKSSMVSKSYKDDGATQINVKSPTITKVGQRITTCLAACHPNFDSDLRNITQAYTQAMTKVRLNIYLETLPEMGL